MTTDPVHPQATRRSGHTYCFTSKHHGGGTAGDARWAIELSHDEEFSIFDDADDFQISDGDGRLFGVLKTTSGELRDLGTWCQQVAEFPLASAGSPWHGYPVWALNDEAPANRSGEKMRPAKDVFKKMEIAGLITMQQRKRLMKGDHA